MALQAAAVEILIEKGRFEPEVALGIAEAIEASIMNAQLVTVPILDARLQEIKAETRISLMSVESKMESIKVQLEAKMEGIKAELVRWVFLAMLGNVALTAGATAVLNAFKNL
jgi:hypothetical protein